MNNRVLDTYLNDLTLGDEESKTHLQYIIGRLYNGIYEDKKMVLFYGPGNGGKSVLMDLLHAIMGASYRVISTDVIHNGGDFRGVRCAVLNEMEHGEGVGFWNMWVKIMTGNYEFATVMVTNQIPFDITNPLISQRVILVPFRAQFVSEVDPNNPSHRRQDEHLRERLLSDQEFMSAFSAWVHDGTLMSIATPIKEPDQD
jgi:phage/plasmid-associated DNA primase